ncbi:MAG: hypothetical protein H6718_03260 [Polyangiaceae bacterium]|nr:hypothetical protein [Myxococcales bacterium]MCB9584385.1 hypothetical protein [Polyangiaceae bacterium]
MAKVADNDPHGKVRRGARHSAPVAPAAVSQANCESALGIPTRKHLELVRTLKLPHSRVGSLIIVELHVYLDALRGMTVDEAPANDAPTIEDVRRALGVAKR